MAKVEDFNSEILDDLREAVETLDTESKKRQLVKLVLIEGESLDSYYEPVKQGKVFSRFDALNYHKAKTRQEKKVNRKQNYTKEAVFDKLDEFLTDLEIIDEFLQKPQEILTPVRTSWIYNNLLAQNYYHGINGQKAIGKTAFLLNIMHHFLKQKNKNVLMFTTSETTRDERIDPFLTQKGYKSFPYMSLIVTRDRFEFIHFMDGADLIICDDILEFLHISEKTVESSQKVNAICDIAKLNRCTFIGAIHQSKSSRKEGDIGSRGSGNAKINTVPRINFNLERITNKKSKFKGKPLLSITTNLPRPKNSKKSYILNEKTLEIETGLEGDPQDIFDEHVNHANVKRNVSQSKTDFVKQIIDDAGGKILTSKLERICFVEKNMSRQSINFARQESGYKWKWEYINGSKQSVSYNPELFPDEDKPTEIELY